jgi:hypothetical protein
MELLELNDKYLTKYGVSYDSEAMKNFLESLINEYGKFERLERKAKNETELKTYYDAYYDECRDISITKVFEDNRMVHKGRHRLLSKTHPKKNLYGFTAVTYPKIFYTITSFLQSRAADFGVFDVYLNPNVYVDCNNQIDLLCDPLSMTNSCLLYNSERHEELIERLRNQAKCLKEFYGLLKFNIIEEKETSSSSLIMALRKFYDNINTMSSAFDMNTYLNPTNNILNDHLNKNYTAYKDIKLARRNHEAIEKIKGLSKDEVKSL